MAGKSTEDTAEKAYAEAAAKLKPVTPAKAPAKAKAKKPAPAKKPAVAAKVVARAKPVVAKKAAPKPRAAAKAPVAAVAKAEPVAPAPEPVAEIVVPDPLPVHVPVAAEPEAVTEIVPPTVIEPKEITMATKTFTDPSTFADTATDAMNELQSRAQAAYEKSTEALGEISDFAKGNVEAIVESGKIVATGVQSLGKSYVEEAKSAYETLTADLKEMAAIKSPTDLFQLQGKIMRRNFDALVAAGSKNTEAAIKLANDAFAPISGRVNLATEKLAKVA